MPCRTATTLRRMFLCRVTIPSKTMYHDGRDWIIEKRGEDYWSFPLDGEEWTQGLPQGLTVKEVETDCQPIASVIEARNS